MLRSVVIVGAGDHQPGEHRADNRRETGIGGGECGDDYHQQCGGENSSGLLVRGLSEQPRQQPAPRRQQRAITTSPRSSSEQAGELPAAASGASAPSTKMTGTSAISSNNNVAMAGGRRRCRRFARW